MKHARRSATEQIQFTRPPRLQNTMLRKHSSETSSQASLIPPFNPRVEPPAAPSSAFDSGLGLFASIAADSEPLAVEIHELRRALAEKETEIQSKNLLLVRSKEALLEATN